MNETLTHEAGHWELRFERELRHAPEKVWRMLTEPDELAHWFPAAIEGERSEGAALRFVFAQSPAPAQTGVMLACEPPRLLAYTWADETLRWEIIPKPDGKSCTLVFTHLIRDRASATRSAAGWELCIERMGERLDQVPQQPPNPSWPARYLRYLQQFGFGAFPNFLLSADNRVRASFHDTPGLEAHAFQGPQGSELLLWHATQDADTPTHRHDREAYLLVIEGSYTLQLGGAELSLQAGHEFHFPQGLPITGSVTRGTRGVLGLGPLR